MFDLYRSFFDSKRWPMYPVTRTQTCLFHAVCTACMVPSIYAQIVHLRWIWALWESLLSGWLMACHWESSREPSSPANKSTKPCGRQPRRAQAGILSRLENNAQRSVDDSTTEIGLTSSDIPLWLQSMCYWSPCTRSRGGAFDFDGHLRSTLLACGELGDQRFAGSGFLVRWM